MLKETKWSIHDHSLVPGLCDSKAHALFTALCPERSWEEVLAPIITKLYRKQKTTKLQKLQKGFQFKQSLVHSLF